MLFMFMLLFIIVMCVMVIFLVVDFKILVDVGDENRLMLICGGLFLLLFILILIVVWVNSGWLVMLVVLMII